MSSVRFQRSRFQRSSFQSSIEKDLEALSVDLTPVEKVVHLYILEGLFYAVSQLCNPTFCSYSQLISTVVNAAMAMDSPTYDGDSFEHHLSCRVFHQAALVCSLIAGTAFGRSELPVLWQVKMGCQGELIQLEEGLTMANQCFDQWMGTLNPFS